MGTNPTEDELNNLPGTPGECFKLLHAEGEVVLNDDQRRFLLWTLGSMEHLRDYADGYARDVARACFRWPNTDIFALDK